MNKTSNTEGAGGPERADAAGTRFVGRGAELRRVVGALKQPPAIVLVEGEAGIGKSRLVREALAEVASASARPLVAQCPPFRTALTLGPIVDAIRDELPDSTQLAALGLSPAAGALRPLFPEWADALPPAPEGAHDADAVRHRLVRAFAELLTLLGIDLLVVEDVHWADEATLELLLSLVSRQPQPLSLMLTFRPEEVADDSLLLRLSSRGATGTGISHARVSLDALTADDAADFVSAMLGGDRVSEALAAFLYKSSDGVPLALEECTRLLVDRADLVRRDGEWTRRAGPSDEMAVPPTIRDAVVERVARLGPDAQRVLLAAAVLTDPADERVLAAVSGLSATSAELPAESQTDSPADSSADSLAASPAESAIGAALDSGLLVEIGSRPSRIAFRHVLAAKAVYSRASAAERRAAHRRAAAALETTRPQPLARLAHHYREAGDIDRWRRYAEQAADVAKDSGDHHTAVTFLHALIMEPQLPAEAVAPLVRKMPVLAFTDYARHSEVLATLDAVLASDRLGPRDRAEVRSQHGRILVILGEFAAAAEELRRALPDLDAGSFAGISAMTSLGSPMVAGTWPAAEHLFWLERAHQLSADSDLRPEEQMALTVSRLTALLELGEESGWTLAAELDASESARQFHLNHANAELNLGDAAMRWGHYGQARRRLASAVELAEQHGYRLVREMALVTLLHLDYFTGAWDGLAERAEQWSATADEMRCRLDAQLVAARLKQAGGGDHVGTEDSLNRLRDEGRRRGALDLWVEAATAQARMRLAADDTARALAVTEEPMNLIAHKEIWIWATDLAPARVAALTAAGRQADAEHLVAAFREGLNGRHAPAALAGLAECGAVLAEARREHESAAREWGAAAQAWSRLPRPPDEARARAGVERCTRAAWKAQQGGRPGYGNQLSPRESDVVALLLQGFTNREIAAALSRSPNTVAAQLKSAMRKFGVTTRTALAVSVTQTGFLLDSVDGQPSPPLDG
jgi:DNA-binding NarL/FixJ family response regulator